MSERGTQPAHAEPQPVDGGAGRHPARQATSGRASILRCPRCRYDVRSSVDQWRDACPIDGRCTECGLVFRWGDVFGATASVPAWSVEFSTVGRWPLAAVVTWCVSATRPRLLWRRLRMAMPVQGWRLAAYVTTLLVVPSLAVILLGQAVRSIRLWKQTQAYLSSGPPIPIPWLAVQVAPGDADWPARLAPAMRFGGRAGDGEDGPGLAPRAAAMLEDMVAQSDRWRSAPPTLDSTGTVFAFRQVFLPLSDAPAAQAVGIPVGGVLPMPAPIESLADMLRSAREIDGTARSGASLQICGAAVSTFIEDAGAAGPWTAQRRVAVVAAVLLSPAACMALLQLLLGAAVFVVLPQTRRRAKVRWVHVGRVTALGAWVAVLPSVVPLAAAGYLDMDILGFAPKATGEVSFGLFAISQELCVSLVRVSSVWAVPVLLWIWWSMAAKHYLKLPHAWGVGLAQAVVATSAVLTMYQVTLLGLLPA